MDPMKVTKARREARFQELLQIAAEVDLRAALGEKLPPEFIQFSLWNNSKYAKNLIAYYFFHPEPRDVSWYFERGITTDVLRRVFDYVEEQCGG